MPVILENGSEEIRTWLNPKRSTWSKELQTLLGPFGGELEVYPVSKEVGKVGNNSPTFIVPVASSENKSNIANFFTKGAAKKESKEEPKSTLIKHEEEEDRKTIDHDGTEDNAPLLVPKAETNQGIKREFEGVGTEDPPAKVAKKSDNSSKAEAPAKSTQKTRSSTSNNTASPTKSVEKDKGSQKITSFFGKGGR
jgi:hypothetical protein